MESRPSNSSISSSKSFFTTSASASIHSRLTVSSSSSLRRFRVPVRADSTDDIPLVEKPKSSPSNSESTPASPEIPDLPLFNSASKSISRPSLCTKLYWIFVLYCTFCVAFFTARLTSFPNLLSTGSHKTQEVAGVSPIDSFSNTYRMARLLQLEASLVSFEPHVFRARKRIHEPAVTACLWIENDELKDLEHWALTWEGELTISACIICASHSQSRSSISRPHHRLRSSRF